VSDLAWYDSYTPFSSVNVCRWNPKVLLLAPDLSCERKKIGSLSNTINLIGFINLGLNETTRINQETDLQDGHVF
jgi:hypothetical protein